MIESINNIINNELSAIHPTVETRGSSRTTSIKKDKEQIINEAITNHNIEFTHEYDKDSLKPVKVRLFTDYNDCPQFGMVLYEIKKTANGYSRSACGNYYPIYEEWLQPHFFQGSICW